MHIHDYCNSHTTPEDQVLFDLERATYLRTLHPQMIAGPQQGKFLEMLSRMLSPERVLEIGGFTGYSAICLGRGLKPNGHLYSVEVNPELGYIWKEFTSRAGLKDCTTLINGDAAHIIPTFPDETFDLIFLDAGKMDYMTHYELALPKLKPGGFLLADNVLWFGKTVHDQKDETAIELRRFNAHVHHDPRVENVMLEIRDGLLLVRKI